ncbi:MAG: 3-hydroxy-5-phosphonooxypentane-2,4-dione thiolase LsrF [Nitrospinota bacterium]
MAAETRNPAAKILKPETGRTVMLAVDHGYFQGPTTGLEDPRRTLEPLVAHCDAVSPTKGILMHCLPPGSSTPIILRASGGNSIVYRDPVELEREFKIRAQGVTDREALHALRERIAEELVRRELSNEGITVSVEEAKRLGVEGVSVSIYVGSRYQKDTILNLARMSDEARKEGLILLGITAVGKELERDARYLALASRIAAEHGADIVKTYYCEDFDKVVKGCFVPVVIAGGKKVPEKEALDFCYRAMSSGAAGVDMGRNIFQSDSPVAMMKAVRAIVHDNLGPNEAYEVFQEMRQAEAVGPREVS